MLRAMNSLLLGLFACVSCWTISTKANALEFMLDEAECCCEEIECELSAYVDVLLIDPCEPGEWAIHTVGNTTRLLTVDYDYAVGVRTGLVFALPCPEWDLGMEFIYYYADGSASGSAGGGTLQTSLGAANAASSWIHTEIDFYQLDLVLSRECCICDGLELIPYGGFRTAWINRYSREWSTGGAFSAAVDGGISDCEYHGYGATVGSKFILDTCADAWFAGHLGGAVLVGCDEFVIQSIQASSITDEVRHKDSNHGLFCLDAELGIYRDFCLCDCPFTLGLSYLNQTYIQIRNPILRVIEIEELNCTIFHGFSLRAGFDF